jgi:hypothetical protein
MKITLENFSDVKKKIAKNGIKKVKYGKQGNAISFTMKNDIEFELDAKNFKNFKSAKLAGSGKKPKLKAS